MQAARGAPLSTSGRRNPSPGAADRRRLLLVFAGVAFLGYLTDLVTKRLAVDLLSDRPPVPVIGDFFTLTLARNPGAAFSIATSYTPVLSVIAISAAVAVLWVARRLGSLGWAIGLGFLLAGVLGNLTDRIFRSPGPLRGHVVDLLSFSTFPVFNFADVSITIAAGLVILQAVRGISVDGRRHDQPADEPADEQENPRA